MSFLFTFNAIFVIFYVNKEEKYMAGAKSNIHKLQFALKQYGYIITINRTQFYSTQQERFIPGYEIKKDNKRIWTSCSTAKTLKYLTMLFNEVRNSSAEQRNSRKFDTIVKEKTKWLKEK